MADNMRVLKGGKASDPQPAQSIHSLEAEEALIGACISNPDQFLIVSGFLKHKDFFFVRHSYIWQALDRLLKRRESIDYLTLTEELRNLGWLELIGGPAHLTQLITSAPTSQHGEVYARIVERCAIRRDMLKAADEVKTLALREDLPIEQVSLDAEIALLVATQRGVPVTEQSAAQLMHEINDIVDRRRTSEDTGFIPTGFKDIDAMIGGLEKGKMHVLAAMTSMGKSLMCQCLARNIGKLNGRVLLLSNEAKREDIGFRLAAIEAGINSKYIRTGKMTPVQYERFVEASSRFSKLNIYTDYVAELTPTKLKAKVARRIYETGVDVLIVDGIYKMEPDHGNYGSRERELSAIGDFILDLSRDLKIPILVTHQVRASIKSERGRLKNGKWVGDFRPRGDDDLAHCKQIGQHADYLYFLHRQSYFDQTTDMPNHTEFIVNKGRDNMTGTISLYFDRSMPAFVDGRVHRVDLGDWNES